MSSGDPDDEGREMKSVGTSVLPIWGDVRSDVEEEMLVLGPYAMNPKSVASTCFPLTSYKQTHTATQPHNIINHIDQQPSHKTKSQLSSVNMDEYRQNSG